MSLAAAMTVRVNLCRVLQYSAQGSRRCRASRPGVVCAVNEAGSTAGLSSRHASGMLIGARGLARVENAATEVLVRLFRR